MFNKLEARVLSEYFCTLIKHYFSFIKHYFKNKNVCIISQIFI
jgi:hypothetical protein